MWSSKAATESPRRRVGSVSDTQKASASFVPTPTYSHVATHRCREMEVQIYSPETTKVKTAQGRVPLPVFGEHDQVGGRITLYPQCADTGTLHITIQGTFLYQKPIAEPPRCTSRYGDSFLEVEAPQPEPRKHVFFTSSKTIYVSSERDIPSSPPRSAFRDVFVPRRRPSAPNLKERVPDRNRSYPFAFEIPRGVRPGEEMPPSYESSEFDPEDSHYFEVCYQVVVSWQASEVFTEPVIMRLPIIVHADKDFLSLDVLKEEEDQWLEMPLRTEKPVPYRLAVTLPTPMIFSRTSSIPFFVVFSTTPKSASLVKEISSDATISVNLLRQITLTEEHSLPPTPPLTPAMTPTSSSEDSASDNPPTPVTKPKLLKRVMKSSRTLKNPISMEELALKPLPKIPETPQQTTFATTQIVHTNFCPGFPKRPRYHQTDSGGHPSLEEVAALPDGLHKSKIPLQKEMLQSIDWAGLTVKYYLDVSVLVGQQQFSARVPIRIR